MPTESMPGMDREPQPMPEFQEPDPFMDPRVDEIALLEALQTRHHEDIMHSGLGQKIRLLLDPRGQKMFTFSVLNGPSYTDFDGTAYYVQARESAVESSTVFIGWRTAGDESLAKPEPPFRSKIWPLWSA